MTSRLDVLLVDDNPINIDLVGFVLGGQGMRVRSARSAAEALEALAAARPDVILMDIQMPGTDGLTLTRRLRDDPATRGITIIAFTAYAMKGDEAKMRAAGCDGYLSKPIDVATFARDILACVAAAREEAGRTAPP